MYHTVQNNLQSSLLFYFFRPNCFQIVVQHFSEEQYIFYFAGEATEQAQVMREGSIALSLITVSSNRVEAHAHLFCPDAESKKL